MINSGVVILLADDDESNRVLYDEILTNAGANVIAVGNGFEAVESANKHLYDLILLDVNMPIMDGREAAYKIRSLGYKNPIVGLTAITSLDQKSELLENGYDGFINKPIAIERFVNEVGIWLHRKYEIADSLAKDLKEKWQQKFVANLTNKFKLINLNFESGQMLEVERIAHQLKGSSATLGYLQFSKLSELIEEEVRKSKPDYKWLKVLIGKLGSSLDKCE